MIIIKKDAQIKKMRLAGQAAARVLEYLAGHVQPGVTTGEIDRAAGEMIAKLGGKSAFLGYRKFPGQTCISVNEEVVHGIGGVRQLKYGDIVAIDVGVILNGWIGDTARTVPCGMIDPETERLCHTTEKILYSALKLATAGRRLGDLCAHVEEQAINAGFSVVKEFVGHGVGRQLHEDPQIPNFGIPGTGPKLKAGMTLAIEPMINRGISEVHILQDGWTVVTADRMPSAHFEHTVLIKPEGPPEILTRISD